MKLKSYIAALHAALFAILLAVSPAGSGSMLLLGAGKAAGGGGGAFAGPLDVSGLGTNVVACHSLRACSSALRGTAAVNACDSTGGTDVTCADLLTDATTGVLVAATIGGGTCPGTLGTNCTIKTWYDQTASGLCGGTCNATQATVANRPTLPATVLGLGTGVARNSTSQELASFSAGFTLAQPITLSSTARRTSGTGLTQIYGASSANTALFFNAATSIEIYAGTGPVAIGTGTENAWHNIAGMFNGASSVGRVDGVSSGTVNPGSSAFSTNTLKIAGVFTAAPLETVEHIMWSADKSSSLAALCTNQFNYWGTAVSC